MKEGVYKFHHILYGPLDVYWKQFEYYGSIRTETKLILDKYGVNMCRKGLLTNSERTQIINEVCRHIKSNLT